MNNYSNINESLEKEVYRTINFPYNIFFKKEKDYDLITLGEYIMPYACSWMFFQLKEPFGRAIYHHEFISHPSLRGSVFVEQQKGTCFRKLNNEEMELYDFYNNEIEGLAIIEVLLQIYQGRFDQGMSEVLINVESPLVIIFVKLWRYLIDRVQKERLYEILYRLSLEATCIASKKGFAISPFVVLSNVYEKLEKKDLKEIDLEIFSKIYGEVMRENDWTNMSPRHTRTVNALGWASCIENNKKNISQLGIRNFLEDALWFPIETCFLYNPDFFLKKRIRILDQISELELGGQYISPLGKFIWELSEKTIKIAEQMRYKEFGEEYFLKYEIPKIGSQYIQELIQDFMSEKPQFFSKTEWNDLETIKYPLGAKKTYLEFMTNFDKKSFENLLREQIYDSLYYADDCINIIEKHAEIAYNKLSDMSDLIFER